MVLAACNNSGTEQNKIKNEEVKTSLKLETHASWILGEWHQVTPEGHSIETWKRQSDSSFIGMAYFIVGKDTMLNEEIKLIQRGEDLFYIPLVKGQNKGLPVEFKSTHSESKNPDEMVFENPQHDFPQKITYERMSEDYLVARISGMDSGKLKTREYPMIRK